MPLFEDIIDGGLSILGEKTLSERRADAQRASDAQQDGNTRREQLDRHADRVDGDAGMDPAAINSKTHWDSWEHARIKQLVDDVDPGRMTVQGDDWKQLASELRARFEDVQHETTSLIAQGWKGEAAEAAASAPGPLSQSGQQLAGAMDATGSRVQQAASGAEQARAMMPEPKEHNWRRSLVSVITPSGVIADAQAQEQERKAAHAQAVRVMSTVYTPSYADVDAATPAFSRPVDPTVPDPGGQPPIPPRPPIGGHPGFQPLGDGRGGNSGLSRHGVDGGHPENSQQPAHIPPRDPHVAPDPRRQWGPGTVDQQWTPGDSPVGNNRPGLQPPPGGSPLPPQPGEFPGGFTSGGVGGRGAGGEFGRGGFSGSAPARGGMGGVGFGGPGGDAHGGATGQRGPGGSSGVMDSGPQGNNARGAARPGGAPGFAGMGAMGQGAQRQEDEVHEIPDFLRTDENTNALIGELPKTVPPVIGA